MNVMRIFYIILFISMSWVTAINAQFTDCYEESNWTIGTNNTGPNTLTPGVVFDNVNNTMTLTADGDFQGLSNNMPAGFPFDCSYDDGIVKACITIPADGTVSFDWNYTMQMFFEDPGNEPFGYCLNGDNFVSLVQAGVWNEQNGTANIPVSVGDELCIVQASYFSEEFQAVSTVSNFSAPTCPIETTLVDCYSEDHWTINTENTNGGVIIDETSIIINADSDNGGTNLDAIDCGAADGNVTVCITAPASGDIIFDWNIDGGPFFNPLVDKFGYCVNGVSTELTSINPPPFGTTSGTDTVTVFEGDNFCFIYASKFADGFASPVNINNFNLPQCPPEAALVDCYAEENWEIDTENTNGSVTVSETTIIMVNDQDFSGSNVDELDCNTSDGMVSICITAPASGDISFDWSIDAPPFFNSLTEKFGYCVNGVSNTLNSIDPAPWGTTSGSETVTVFEGDEFCFVYASKFADGFSAPVSITYFSMPQCPPEAALVDCFEEENWAINTENTNGSVTMDETSIVMVNDQDFSGSNLDILDCNAADGLVSVCITMPTSGDISFDWAISAPPFFNGLTEKFGYCINGVSTTLNSIDPFPWGTVDGSETVTVFEGDEFCFVYASKFADGFNAPVEITYFGMPQCPPAAALVDCYAEENWDVDTTNVLPGTVNFSETSIVIVNDQDFSGSNLDTLDCGATDGMTSVCITIPESGDVQFNWAIDFPPFFNGLTEKFGYCHNGVPTTLNSNEPFPWGTTSGTVTVDAEAGDEFCFVYASKFADGFNAPVTIDYFFLPECPLEMAMELAVVDSISCFGDSTATLLVEVSGGVEEYTYEWDNTLAEGANPTNLPAGTYCVTITDAINGTINSCIEITEPAELTNTVSSTPENEGEMDGTATVVASGGIEPYTYSWNTDPEQTTSVATNLNTGTYWVTITDANGCESINTVFVDQTTGINEIEGLNRFEIFPNPSKGQVSINIDFEQASNIKLELYNSLGQRVYSIEEKSISNIQDTFEWSKLPKGMYWLSLSVNDERTTKRLILQ